MRKMCQLEQFVTWDPNREQDGRRVGQCTRFSKPKFRIIGVLTYI